MPYRRLRPLLLPGAFIALALVLGWALFGYLLPRWLDPANLIYKPATPSIIITDRQGRVLYEAIDPRGNKHVPLALDDIPAACRDATIATEDANFYHHPGVDPIAIARAAWLNWRAGETVSGGSTLTQQLARNLLLTAEERQERSLQRKLREGWLAWRLERRYSKDELLALYLNTTYYGHFATGIEAASQAYFGVHAPELDLAQCALLAGLPQSPALYNPIENPDAARTRQAVVLGLMVRHGYLDAAQAEDAHREALAYASTPFPIRAPHFVMWTLSRLETLLPPERIAAGDLRVTTTLDLDWQAAAEQVVARRLAQLRPCTAVPDALPGVNCDADADPARRAENAALVALDPATGAVVAMVGSPDYFDVDISGALNASLSLRQPGSAIKPLTYAAALDPARAARAGRAPWTAATLIADLRTAFTTAEGTPYVPNNYDRTYHGPVTVRQALANSYNIPAVKTLDYVGVEELIDMAVALGIPWQRGGASAVSAAVPATTQPAAGQWTAPADETPRYGLSLTLGGGEVALLDLTAAYGALANGGRPVEPYGIARVTTLDGQEVIPPVSRNTSGRPPVIDPRVAYLITDILSDDHARQPAFGTGSVLQLDRPAAAKTGTTTDWRDNWTLGYTPGLVTGVWVGNADNTPMKDINGISGAGPIWHDFMLAVHKGQPRAAFTVPAGLVQVEVCADSGLLPECPAGGAACVKAAQPVTADATTEVIACPHRRLEYFIPGTEPAEVDRSHVLRLVDVRTGEPATGRTPSQYAIPQTYWLLPPEYAAWAREERLTGIAVAGAPLSFAAAEDGGQQARPATRAAVDNTAPLALVSPDPQRTYRIDPALPASAQEVPVTALPRFEPQGKIVLLVDGATYGTLAGPEFTAWWPLAKGRHTFEAVTVAADGTEVRSGEVIVFVE